MLCFRLGRLATAGKLVEEAQEGKWKLQACEHFSFFIHSVLQISFSFVSFLFSFFGEIFLPPTRSYLNVYVRIFLLSFSYPFKLFQMIFHPRSFHFSVSSSIFLLPSTHGERSGSQSRSPLSAHQNTMCDTTTNIWYQQQTL